MDGVRLFTAPVVRLVGKPAVAWGEVGGYFGELGLSLPLDFDDDKDGQTLIELGARTCYQSYGKGRPHSEHIRHLQAVGHFSCDEHAQYTFLIAGVSRALTHELVRHRHLSPSQLSQRYCDQSAHNLGLVVPVAYLDDYREWEWYMAVPHLMPSEKAVSFGTWRACQRGNLLRYKSDVDRNIRIKGMSRKEAHDAARSVLPECCETRMMLSANLRAWREMVGKRCQPEAAAEIRRLANRIFDLLAAEAPDVFADLTRVPLGDGTFALDRGGE